MSKTGLAKMRETGISNKEVRFEAYVGQVKKVRSTDLGEPKIEKKRENKGYVADSERMRIMGCRICRKMKKNGG